MSVVKISFEKFPLFKFLRSYDLPNKFRTKRKLNLNNLKTIWFILFLDKNLLFFITIIDNKTL